MATCRVIPTIVNKSGAEVESILYASILNRVGDRDLTRRIYYNTMSDEYFSIFGDWINSPNKIDPSKLDANGEPLIDYVFPYFNAKLGSIPKRGLGSRRLSQRVTQYGIKEGSNAVSLLRRLSELTANDNFKDLTSKLLANTKAIEDVSVEVVSDPDVLYAMQYDSTGKKPVIRVNTIQMNTRSTSEIEQGILHEIMHGYTAQALSAPEESLTDAEAEYARNMKLLWNVAKNSDRIPTFGIKNVQEFVAEIFTEPFYAETLNRTSNGSFLSKLAEFFRRLFNIPSPLNDAVRETLSYVDQSFRGNIGVKSRFNIEFPDAKQKAAEASEKILTTREKLLRKAIDAVQRRINEFENRPKLASDDPTQIRRDKSLAVTREEKRSLNRKFLGGHTELGLIEAVLSANSQLKGLRNRLIDKNTNFVRKEINLPLLNEIYRYAKAFKIIKDIREEMLNEPEDFTPIQEDIFAVIDQAEKAFSDIESVYIRQSKRLMVDKLLPFERKAEARYREQAEREFNTTNKRKDFKNKREYDEAKRKFINSSVDANRDVIRSRSRRLLTEQFEVANQDIGNYEFWALAIQNSGDQLLAIAKELHDRAESKVRLASIKDRNEMEDLLLELRKFKGNPTKLEDLYGDFLEVDSEGKHTNFLVAPTINAYESAYKEVLVEARNIDDFKERKKFTDAWLKENAVFNPEWKQIEAEALKQRRKIAAEKGDAVANQFFTKWKSDNKHRKWVPAPKWRSSQYDKLMAHGPDHILVRFYKHLISKQEEADRGRPDHKKLGYRLPGIRKTQLERTLGSGLPDGQAIKNMATRPFQMLRDDEEFGERDKFVDEDIVGDVKKFVPLFYTSPLDDPSEQSLDLAKLSLVNSHLSHNYREVHKILPELDALGTIIGNRQVKQRTGLGNAMIKRTSGEPHTVDGTKSKAFELYNRFMADKIFGEKYVPQKILGLNPKVWSKVMGYTSTVMLAGNVSAALMNVTYANSQLATEILANNFISAGDMVAAGKSYFKHLVNPATGIVGDIGRDKKLNELNRLSEHFDARNNFDTNHFDYADNNWWKKLLKSDNLHALNNLGEHWNQNSVFLAILHSAKVVDESGQYLDKEGNATSRDKARTLIDAFSLDEKNNIVINPEIKHIDLRGKVMPWNEDAREAITRRTRAINTQLHGAYSQQNRPEMQRWIAGRFASQMRRWLVPGIERRWSGAFSLGSKETDATKKLNQELGILEEGSYVTGLRFIRDYFRSLNELGYDVAPRWRQLTDYEKGNIKKTVVEATLMALSMWAFTMFENMGDEADEDEENRYFFAAYQARRLFSELTFYVNPVEAFRILKDPAPTVSLIEDVGGLIYQLGSPTEEYVRGRRKGQLKIRKDFERVFPFYRHWDRINNMEESLSFFDLN